MKWSYCIKKTTVIYIIEGLAFYAINALGIFSAENAIYSAFLTGVLCAQLIWNLYKNNSLKSDQMFLLAAILALFVRIMVMYYDVAIQEIDPGDSRDFREAAHYFAITNQPIMRGAFSVTTIWLGMICKVFGTQRIMPQLFCLLLFIKSADYAYRSLKKIGVPAKGAALIIGWMLFTPQNIINTSISNREAIIGFFISIAMYNLVRYIETVNIKMALFSMLAAIAAASMHSGALFAIVPVGVAVAFYSQKSETLKWNVKTFLWIAMGATLLSLLYIPLQDILFAKFQSLEDFSSLGKLATVSTINGSDYRIPGENISGLGGFFVTTPMRMVYYLISPTPEYWRGMQDIAAFVVCSIPQIVIWWTAIKNGNRWKQMDKKVLAIYICLLIGYVAVAIVFGWGCKNTGTAIRHRDKFLSMQVLLLGVGLFPLKCKMKKGKRG